MMMKDEQLKNILADSKIKASDNFKNRVMHQIEMEAAFRSRSKKKKTPAYSALPLLGIFGVMYGLIILVGLFLYLSDGSAPWENSLFVKAVGLIASITSLFFLITAFDDFKFLKAGKTVIK